MGAENVDQAGSINLIPLFRLKVGLRTLCIASRELTSEEFEAIDRKLDEAQKSITDREAQLAAVFEEVENNYTLLGATAVEDK